MGIKIGVGEYLRELRTRTGFTQEMVAEKLSVTRQTLSNWEQNKAMPDLIMFAQLATIYNFSPDEFLLGKRNTQRSTNMRTNYSDAQIEHFIKKWYRNIDSLTPLTVGLVSQTFSFNADGEAYLFQIGNSIKTYEKEKYISEHFGHNLPFRKVLIIEETENGDAYCLAKYLDGTSVDKLNHDQRKNIITPLLEVMDKLAKIQIPAEQGYGFFDARGYAPYQSWLDFLRVVTDTGICDWSRLSGLKIKEKAVYHAIEEIKNNITLLDYQPANLVLGDFNVLVNNNQIVGIIDSDTALYGDPLYCVAGQLFWDVLKNQDITKAVLANYLTSDNNRNKIYCYTLRYALEEIYNTVILNEIGYNAEWLFRRLEELLKNGLCHTELLPI